MKTRREELIEELQKIDRQIYALQNDRDELQKQYDETPETQAAKNDVDTSFHERMKAFADGLGPRGLTGLDRIVPGDFFRK